MGYGYTLLKDLETGLWALRIGNDKPKYFKKMHEALRIIQYIRLHVKPEHKMFVA